MIVTRNVLAGGGAFACFDKAVDGRNRQGNADNETCRGDKRLCRRDQVSEPLNQSHQAIQCFTVSAHGSPILLRRRSILFRFISAALASATFSGFGVGTGGAFAFGVTI
ncbi:hypothetical protein HGG76_27895 [Ochrobactrum tritici]|uniref:Uncharacterized protein n=1 Tax=Brucella tritici TaxID=94626 RepID=A0A7X6JBY7_9HYPH|nr:hypothetical protein [Brucella tritici]